MMVTRKEPGCFAGGNGVRLTPAFSEAMKARLRRAA